jgi:hypothetical protein
VIRKKKAAQAQKGGVVLKQAGKETDWSLLVPCSHFTLLMMFRCFMPC